MKKTFWVILLLAGLFAPACVDNDVSIYISNAVLATVEEDSNNPGMYLCKFEAGASPYCQKGKLDLVGTNWGSPLMPVTSPTLMLTMIVGNRLPDNTNVERGELNTHNVRISSIEMRFKWMNREIIEQNPSLAPLLGLEESDVLSVGYVGENLIPSGSTNGDPVEIMMTDITIVPQEIGVFLQSVMGGMQDSELNQVILGCYIRLVGRTNGNQHVESDDFFFPVGFCNDCVQEGYGCYLNQTPYSQECVK